MLSEICKKELQQQLSEIWAEVISVEQSDVLARDPEDRACLETLLDNFKEIIWQLSWTLETFKA